MGWNRNCFFAALDSGVAHHDEAVAAAAAPLRRGVRHPHRREKRRPRRPVDTFFHEVGLQSHQKANATNTPTPTPLPRRAQNLEPFPSPTFSPMKRACCTSFSDAVSLCPVGAGRNGRALSRLLPAAALQQKPPTASLLVRIP